MKRRSSEEKKEYAKPTHIITQRQALVYNEYLDVKSRSPKLMPTKQLGDVEAGSQVV